MIDRICISINNRCNLRCKYCHFNEKNSIVSSEMDIFKILKNVKEYANHTFKIGFVGNGEPFLDIELLKSLIKYISDNKWIQTYTITNGTIDISQEDIKFLEDNHVNVGFSIDGYKSIHNKYRDDSYDRAIANMEKYKRITGHYPTLNVTVGKDTIEESADIITYFKQFDTRVTLSRMIGKYGIGLDEYRIFIEEAAKHINVRKGGLDCTMYGGKCGAGINNYFFANGKVFYCGTCIDLLPVGESNMSFFDLEKQILKFNRDYCYKESIL